MNVDKGTITLNRDKGYEEFQNRFHAMITENDFKFALRALKKAGTNSDRPSKVAELCNLFEACGIQCERGKDNSYYENLVRTSNLLSPNDIEARVLIPLFELYKKYPSPEDYMKRTVKRLCAKDDGWENDALRLQILKRFIKYGNYLCDAGYGSKAFIRKYVRDQVLKSTRMPSDEEVLQNLDDAIFSGLASASKDEKKSKGKYGLLKVADDLASGKFRVEGATKRSLYLFGMVYGMTYNPGTPEKADYKSDFELNLFKKYYNNNLIRFISYQGQWREYELDPTGHGINYRNFAEAIYLYYISRELEPQEKIRRSCEMITRIKESRPKSTAPGWDDAEYEEEFKMALDLPEKEFEEFICRNYNCNVPSRQSEMLQETVQDTAFEEYKIISDRLKKKYTEAVEKKIQNGILMETYLELEKCNYGLWLTDTSISPEYENVFDQNSSIDREEWKQFLEFLRQADYFVKDNELADNFRKETTRYADRKDAVTRTAIIVAYYYWYNVEYLDEDSMGGTRKNKTFEEVFKEFKSEIDPILEKAHYQEFSGENIIDVLLAFSAYTYRYI